MPTTTPPRSAIAPEHTWNAPSVFPTTAAWEAELGGILAALPEVAAYQGRLAEGPAVLAEAMQAIQVLIRRVGVVASYALMDFSVDTTNPEASARQEQAHAMQAQVLGSLAFLDPELLALGETTLRRWMEADGQLAVYGHYVDNLFRQQAHVRSTEVETLLGYLAEPFSGPATVASMLTNADMRFALAHSRTGQAAEVTQGSIDTLLASPDREVRRTAWENYADTYLAFKNTLAANLGASIRQNAFQMRARKHPSTLAASLFENNIPVEVFHNLIDTFQKNLPVWHRYWAIRRKALGVDTLAPYDVWAPLTPPVTVPYAQAVDWICDGLAFLGEDYVRAVRQGCLQDRWVDVYPNQGKTAGAFSAGAPGTAPFILMSYDDTVFSLGTLAHELGHSMHSYLTWQQQPIIYSSYSLFVAEVASNFHQAMLRAHLLKTIPDRQVQIGVIEEAMATFHRYFFIMPTLARFELEMHERAERGQSLTADGMTERMADLFSEGFGDQMALDRPRVGITWAQFPHLYIDYYVYQYATGISGANALARRILEGAPGAAEDYRRFLSAGSSLYPLEALKLAGVDLSSPQPVEDTFAVLRELLDRLETLVSAQEVI